MGIQGTCGAQLFKQFPSVQVMSLGFWIQDSLLSRDVASPSPFALSLLIFSLSVSQTNKIFKQNIWESY